MRAAGGRGWPQPLPRRHGRWRRWRGAVAAAAFLVCAAAAHAHEAGSAQPAGAPDGTGSDWPLVALPGAGSLPGAPLSVAPDGVPAAWAGAAWTGVEPVGGAAFDAVFGAPGLTPFDAAAAPGAPVPYTKGEFPGWLRDIRRAEVITIGAFPITLLFSSLGYQLYRSLTGVTTQITQPEQIGVLLGGVGLAATVGLVDFILGKIQPPPKQEDAP